MSLAKRKANPFSGAWPVCRKEFVHISRDRATLFFALLLPVMQLLFFGFAIDTNIRQIPTIVYDEARTQESRQLLDKFVNSDAFRINGIAHSDKELYSAIVAGKAKAGLKIPADLSRRLQDGQQATVLVMIDGSDSTVTSYAVNVSNGILLQESLRRVLGANSGPMPLEARQSVLFNPSTRSANFFVPGMIAIVIQAMIMMLVAFSVVREREKGTSGAALTHAGDSARADGGQDDPLRDAWISGALHHSGVDAGGVPGTDPWELAVVTAAFPALSAHHPGVRAADIHQGEDARGGVSACDGNAVAVRVPFRVRVHDRKHACGVSVDESRSAGDIFHRDLARPDSSRRRLWRSLGGYGWCCLRWAAEPCCWPPGNSYEAARSRAYWTVGFTCWLLCRGRSTGSATASESLRPSRTWDAVHAGCACFHRLP